MIPKPIAFPIFFYIEAPLKEVMVRNGTNNKTDSKSDGTRAHRSFMVGIIALFGIVIFLTLLTPAEGETIVVDDDGSADYSTIQAAVNSSKDGDTVLVRDGVYLEHVIVTKRITLLAAENETPIIDGGGKDSPLDIRGPGENSSGITTISGFEFQGSGVDWNPAYDSCVRLDEARNVIIEDCHMYGNGGIGIGVLDCSDIIIRNNRITLCDDGILLRELEHMIPRRITITNNTILRSGGISLGGYGHRVSNNTILYLGSIGVGCNDSLIHNNTVGEGSGWGMYLHGDGNTISNNTIYNNSGSGLMVMGTGNSILGNAIVNHHPNIGMTVHQDKGVNNTISHNRLLNNGFHISQWNKDFTLIMEDNTLDGRRIVFMQRVHGTPREPIVIENNAATVYLYDCSHIEIRNNTLSGGPNGIWIYDCENINIIGNEIRDNHWSGIFILGRDCSIINNDIHHNLNGIEVNTNYRAVPGDVAISGNRFWNNSEFAVSGTRSERRVVARENWWGDNSGPSGTGPGSGDRISGNVIYDPWLTEEGDLVSGKKDSEGSLLPIIVLGIGLGGVCTLGFLREDLRLFLATMAVLPLYSKLERDEILQNENRSELFQYISRNPGVHYASLRREMPFGSGTLVHHIAFLKQHDMIRTSKKYGRVFYFPSGLSFADQEKSIERPLSMNQEAILNFLRNSQPVSSKDIQNGCSLSQSSVNYSLSLLMKDGLIVGSIEENGSRTMKYRLRDQSENIKIA